MSSTHGITSAADWKVSRSKKSRYDENSGKKKRKKSYGGDIVDSEDGVEVVADEFAYDDSLLLNFDDEH